MDDAERRLAAAYAVLNRAAPTLMAAEKAAAAAVEDAHTAFEAANRAAKRAADARSSTRLLFQEVRTALDMLDADEGTAP